MTTIWTFAGLFLGLTSLAAIRAFAELRSLSRLAATFPCEVAAESAEMAGRISENAPGSATVAAIESLVTGTVGRGPVTKPKVAASSRISRLFSRSGK